VLEQQPDDRNYRQLLHDLLAEKTIHKGKYAAGASRDAVESIGVEIPANEDVMGRVLTFEEQVERRIAKNPQDTANYVELAMWYSKHSDLARAEETYARAATASQNAPDMVAYLLETQKKRLHAETLRLKEEYETNLQEEVKLVFFDTRSRYEAKSIELAQHRVKHHPNHMGYRYDYGILLQKEGQVKEAIAEFQLAKEEPSRKGDCLLALGQCFQMIRQYKLAMTHYQEAVSVLESGGSKKRALYLAMKLAFTLEDYGLAESYGHQLAAIDFSYRDLGDILDQIAQRQSKP
jgi:tetratricopeptide (TPR) repeat protein